MASIEKETDKKDDPENNGENGAYGIGNIVYGILDTPDLGKKAVGNQQ